MIKQQVTKPTIFWELNRPINLADEVQVFAEAGSGAVMVARSPMPDPFACGMCLLVEL
jgi:hypothetical protein